MPTQIHRFEAVIELLCIICLTAMRRNEEEKEKIYVYNGEQLRQHKHC